MKRAWILVAIVALLGGCATYRQADGYYVEDAPSGGTVIYRDPGAPWVDPYYNPFFGNYLPAYGYAPYVYDGGYYDGGPAVVYRRHDHDHDRRAVRAWAAPRAPDPVFRRPPTRLDARREIWRDRNRPAIGRPPAWQGPSQSSGWRAPRPAVERSAPARRPAQRPRREPRHDRRH